MGSIYVRPYWLDKDYIPGSKYRKSKKRKTIKTGKDKPNKSLELLEIKSTKVETISPPKLISKSLQSSTIIYPNTKTKKECLVSDKIALLLNGSREVDCYPVGRIDVLTDSEVIEVKEDNWKHAIGQVLIYGHYHPNKTKVIYLFGDNAQHYFSIALEHCQRLNIELRMFEKLDV